MKKHLLRSCPVCNNINEGEVLHTQSFTFPQGHILSEVKEYDIVSCLECGFVFADTGAPQELYDKYYAEMSKYEMNYSNVELNRFMSTAKLIKSLIQDDKIKVIDVGAGNGGLLMALKSLGNTNLNALDPSEKCISIIRKNGMNGFLGTIFKHEIKEKYDLIILSHVLEHIKDVNNAIDKLSLLLNENGMLYIETPDAASYYDNYFVPYHYFDMEHINHFEETSLINLGFNKGFGVISLGKKLIELSAQVKYPAIYVLYKKTGINSTWNNHAKICVNKYIKLSEEEKKVYGVIEELMKEKKKIIIWGAGSYTMRLLKNSALGNCNIIAYVDNDPKKQGLIMDGKPIVPPDEISKMDRGAVIAICSAIYKAEISEEIKNMKLSNEIVLI